MMIISLVKHEEIHDVPVTGHETLMAFLEKKNLTKRGDQTRSRDWPQFGLKPRFVQVFSCESLYASFA